MVGVGVGQASVTVRQGQLFLRLITTAPCESHHFTLFFMSSRKRRRSQAFHQEEIEIEVEQPDIHVDEDEVDEKGQEDKEREVWDLVREERYESARRCVPRCARY